LQIPASTICFRSAGGRGFPAGLFLETVLGMGMAQAMHLGWPGIQGIAAVNPQSIVGGRVDSGSGRRNWPTGAPAQAHIYRTSLKVRISHSQSVYLSVFLIPAFLKKIGFRLSRALQAGW